MVSGIYSLIYVLHMHMYMNAVVECEVRFVNKTSFT